MKNPIELCNADLNRSIFKEVMFFSIAETGAMGEPGAIWMFLRSGTVYHFNYVFGDAKINKVEKLFPILADCKFEPFGMKSSVPEGWHYVNLGMGNHLIVKDEVYPAFKEIIAEDTEPSIAYMNWMKAAESVLS